MSNCVLDASALIALFQYNPGHALSLAHDLENDDLTYPTDTLFASTYQPLLVRP